MIKFKEKIYSIIADCECNNDKVCECIKEVEKVLKESRNTGTINLWCLNYGLVYCGDCVDTYSIAVSWVSEFGLELLLVDYEVY